MVEQVKAFAATPYDLSLSSRHLLCTDREQVLSDFVCLPHAYHGTHAPNQSANQ